ncbi:roadblock/LC7 domain-containing protein [Streptomyces sp. NPDC046977]|uniref:roadblock/LC7 domain-containing protein n=1 Tax=Streptomyces sp. NPDC046977 TaxID=3154703 RepID=UPI00340E79FC
MTRPRPCPAYWLLNDFVRRVPGVQSAFLASSDGIELATSGLSGQQPETAAAVVASLYSLARGAGRLTPRPSTDVKVRQVVIELDSATLFLTVAGDGLPQGVSVQYGADPRKASSVLGVMAGPEANVGLIGHEMATMIRSVAEHLVTDTRRGSDQGR